MIRNYFKIAWRNLNRHKLFSLINIFGLASGMAVCMLALIKIKEAYDYDTFHPNSNRTYRVITNLNRNNGDHLLTASSPLALSNYIKDNYKAIDKSASVHFSQEEVTANSKKLSVKEAYVDPDFYNMFGFKLLYGSPAVAAQTVVLTIETAEKFFGKANPIGQTITIGKSEAFLVTGILGKPKSPSHLKFDLLASTSAFKLRQKAIAERWTDEAAAYTYVQLKAGADKSVLQNILQNVTKQVSRIVPPSSGKSFVFDLQPLDKISPGTKPMYNTTNEPIMPNLIAFASIGFFMLLLAFFNYINLTLARSLDRAREVGIRKVAGARKYDIMLQFLSESILVAILAFGFANILLQFIIKLPTVQNIIGDATQDKRLWFYFIAFTIITGLIAGWIPAKVFSGFQPVRVLKGKFNAKLFGGVGLRKTLTVIQFAASLIAIVTLVIFYRQSVYMSSADYGFKTERILNIPLPDQSYETASVAFASIASVEAAAGTSGLFGFSAGETRFIKREDKEDSISAIYFSVSPSFISTMGLQLIAGENLPAEYAKQVTPFVLVNEEACRVLQFKNASEATGKLIWINDSTNYRISGVVKDFHFSSFIKPIQPLLLANQPDQYKILNLKIANGVGSELLTSLEATWKKLYPHQPFEAQWYEEQLHDQHLHKDDLMFIGMLTVMALLIACLGLLGMVIYTTKNRSKEVGIRRVMGATVGQVVHTVSKEFVNLLLLSICIGLPLGILTGSKFLQQYAYRIQISFGIVAGSAAILLFIGTVTIGWQVYRTALANPVKSLRME